MLSLTNLVGKSVISIADGKIVGTMLGAKFNRSLKNLRYFELFCDDDGKKSLFSPKSVASIIDAVVLQNGNKLISPDTVTDCAPCPINLPVYTALGKFIGRVSDIILDKTAVVSICAGELTFSPSQIKSKSDNLIVIDHEVRETKINTVADAVVEQSEFSLSEPIMLKSSFSANASDNVNSAYSFLLGRKVAVDIVLNGGGLVLARSGDIIDERMIARASENGKMLLLASNAR